MMTSVSTSRYFNLDAENDGPTVCMVRTAKVSSAAQSWGVIMAIQTLKRWGNSLAVRIPASVAQEARLAEGQEIDVQVVDGKVHILAHTAIKRFSRERYLQQLRDARLEPHAAVDFGAPQGSELGGPDELR